MRSRALALALGVTLAACTLLTAASVACSIGSLDGFSGGGTAPDGGERTEAGCSKTPKEAFAIVADGGGFACNIHSILVVDGTGAGLDSRDRSRGNGAERMRGGMLRNLHAGRLRHGEQRQRGGPRQPPRAQLAQYPGAR